MIRHERFQFKVVLFSIFVTSKNLNLLNQIAKRGKYYTKYLKIYFFLNTQKLLTNYDNLTRKVQLLPNNLGEKINYPSKLKRFL